MTAFRSGFVNIIGFPNAGKSTLVNRLIGEKISIVTHKPQTTRQRIFGILNGENYQMVISDTPGILDPKYELQQFMLDNINEALEDADVILYLIEANDSFSKHQSFIEKLGQIDVPKYLIINKIDLTDQPSLEKLVDFWRKFFVPDHILPLSALHGFNTKNLIDILTAQLPEGEPYYPEDMFTDQTERYITSEVIREKIFLKFREEIPYSTEVVVNLFKEEEGIIRISADIYVSRRSQKPIIIGVRGMALKEIGTEARLELEKFFSKKVFLELYVRIKENWRDKKLLMRQLGYKV